MSFREIIQIPGVSSVLFTLFMVAFGFGIVLPILPFYVTSLGAKPFELGLLTATFALVSFLVSPVLGKWSDTVGRKKILLFGTAGFVLSYLIFAVSDSLWMTFLARAVEGAAAGAIFPSCVSLISDLTSEKQRGAAMGLFGMTFSLGFIFGPAFGGLASGISVQAAFLLSAALACANFAAVYFRLEEPKEKTESRDLPQKEITLLQHLSSPLLFLFLSAFMITFMIGGIDATLALYTAEKLGFGSTEVGLIFTFIGLLIMIMQFVGGALINRFGELAMIRVGLVLSGLGFFLLQFATDWSGLLAPLAIFVAGNATVFPSVSSLITKKVTARRGAVLGLAGSFNSLGQVIGPLFAGFLYGIHHSYAFLGNAVVIWGYAVLFSLVAVPVLMKPNVPLPGGKAKSG